MQDSIFAVHNINRILPKAVCFNGVLGEFERVDSITDCRRDATEARILYICRRRQVDGTEAGSDVIQTREEKSYVLKCKIQVPVQSPDHPDGFAVSSPGPSDESAAEIEALKAFADTKARSLPHLIAWKTEVQPSEGPLPGGYITYTLMNLMPGHHLLDLKFWSMPEELKDEIRTAFLVAIRAIWQLGFKPYDCALRNILWDTETRKLSIVDFEHWHRITATNTELDERAELQKWGLVQRPAALHHFVEWANSEKLMRN